MIGMEEMLIQCEKSSSTEPLYGKLIDLFHITENKECLIKTREVIQEIKQDATLVKSELVMNSLSLLFFKPSKTGSKVSVRRLISSFFNGLPKETQKILKSIFHELILSKTTELITNESSCTEVRQNVDILASLLENFPMGEDCVILSVISYTNYLINAHKQFLRSTKVSLSPVDLNKAMHDCLVTEQLINRMLQKCFECLQEKMAAKENSLYSTLYSLMKTNVDILNNDNMLMDCRCNAGITVTLVMRLCCGDQLGRFLVKMFGNMGHDMPTPNWLKSCNVLNLNKLTLSTSSYLCLLFGSLSMLNSNDLTVIFDQDLFLFTDIFLSETLQLISQVTNPASKVILAKLVNLWTEKALSLTNETLDLKLRTCLVGGSDIVSNVLDYVWNAVDDSLDAVRQNGRLAFDQMLKTHLRLVGDVDINSDPFVTMLIQDVLAMPWCKRGKYAPLTCLVGSVGTSRLLEACPDLTQHVIYQLQDHALACYCSEFYEKLYTCHKLELPPEKSSEWYRIWVNPVVESLCANTKSTKNHILHYVLPKLMSCSNDILQYMIEYISGKECQSKGTLGALIMCLRRGRSLGLLDDKKSDSSLWCGIVHVDVLKYALSSSDEQIRLDTFSLLCENKKTSKPIQAVEFNLMKLFIPKNLNNQSPSFRQHVSAYTRKFFIRMKDSESSLIRQLEKSKKEDEILTLKTSLSNYTNFITWLHNHLYSCLYPGAAFAMRTSSLKMLSNMIEVLPEQNTNGHSFSFFPDFGKAHVYALLECLADTFEENKIEALKMINGYLRPTTNPIFREAQLKELFDTCIDLSVSTKPQDSTASAYLFRCLLQHHGIEMVIETHKLNLKMISVDRGVLSKEVLNEPEVSYLRYLEMMVLLMTDQTEVAKRGLMIAAANRPIYPSIQCIRYVLGDVNLKACSRSKGWKDCLGTLIKACLEVAKVVSPIVQDSSPEGNVPVEAIRGPGLNFDAIAQSEDDQKLMLEAEESEKTVILMPEYLVVCCWRSIKEVSLLLGEITLKASIEDLNGHKEGLLSFEQILEIGEYFITQLLKSKHRGAFELAYAGFVMMCERLWRSQLSQLHQLPVIWLDKLLVDIETDDGNSGMCSTRRSAGIPFYVQALLITEPVSNEQRCFNKAMTRLLDLAVSNSSTSIANNPSKVHALNTLKVLFKDNKLGDFVSPYISDGLIAAILGFKSEFWSVRNSSTLLLSAMMTRIFGVKVSKDDSDISRKNCLTGKAFFHRFPKIYNFLLQEFEAATADTSSTAGVHLHPCLYPVLMVLGRLYPSAMEGTDTTLNLAAFVPLIVKCATSPVFKTRVMAARAIQPLVEKDRLPTILVELLQLLPKLPESITNNNHIHGILLQIKYLLDSVLELNISVMNMVLDVFLPAVLKYTWIMSGSICCPLTLEIAFVIIDRVLSLVSGCSKNLKDCPLYSYFVLRLHEVVTIPLEDKPGSTVYLGTMAKLALKYTHLTDLSLPIGNSIQLWLLKSHSYEVRISVLDEILIVLKNQDTEKDKFISIIHDSLLFTTCLQMALCSEWHFECLGRVFDVLSCFPNCIDMIMNSHHQIYDGQSSMSPIDIFLYCLRKLDSETRDSLKCSILRFISRLLEHIYRESQTTHSVLSTWCQKIREYSSTEQDADLQLAVGQSILDNANILLVDPNDVLKSTSFQIWEIVFDLLQEDDLDVKDVASKIINQLEPSFQGDVQPACALEILLDTFIHIHFIRQPLQVVKTLLSLLQGENEEEFEDERLFDKSEMNTYRDELYFLRLVAKCIKTNLKHIHYSVNNDHDFIACDIPYSSDHNCSMNSSTNQRVLCDITKLDGLFSSVSKHLSDRLNKHTAWSVSASFRDTNSHSTTVTELCRALLFLHCCKNDSFLSNLVSVLELQKCVRMLLENSCINYCIDQLPEL